VKGIDVRHQILQAGIVALSFTVASSASASCRCTGKPIDSCLPGTWSMNASELSRITDNFMKDQPGRIEWRGGRVVMQLKPGGDYANQLNDIEAAMTIENVGGMGMEVSGGTEGAYCADAGKLCFQEKRNSLKMVMTVAGTNQQMALPISQATNTQAVNIDYTCSSSQLSIRVQEPISGLDASFDLNRQ